MILQLDIPEGQDGDSDDKDGIDSIHQSVGFFQDAQDGIKALKSAFEQCWSLCDTLANLSHIHRERIFNIAGKGDVQEQAWKSCWKLCQKLYETREDDTNSHVRPTLDLCRDFCQSLFEVRERDNEVADSVLRVSFELNNHLYNTHDRNLPEAFRERTLDFYITLCHRLMKQKSRLAEESEALLRACWSLTEMLFSLRQNKREGRESNEELLGSVVQACWELCDLFREGWTQIRPDRGTPRPSQATFTQTFLQAQRAGERAAIEETNAQRGLPETPTTIFEDTVTTSEEEEAVPNIVLIGQHPSGNYNNTPRPSSRSGHRWSSASPTSSRTSATGSSAHTVRTPSEDPNLTLLKVLFIKAAMNAGYQRSSPLNLPTWVKTLPDDSFGLQSWQVSLLNNFKKVVQTDPSFINIGMPVSVGAVDVAKAVQTMVQGGYYIWLKDLYRLVFGFYIEEADGKRMVGVET